MKIFYFTDEDNLRQMVTFMEHIHNHKCNQINEENVIMIFYREYIGKLNKIRSLFRNFNLLCVYCLIERQCVFKSTRTAKSKM